MGSEQMLYDPRLPVEHIWDFDIPNDQTPIGPFDLHLTYPYTDNAPPKPSSGQAVLWCIGLLGVASLLWRRRFRQAVPMALFSLSQRPRGGSLRSGRMVYGKR